MTPKRTAVVFVGQAPSTGSDTSEPLTGRRGRFLANLMDAPMSEFLSMKRVHLNESKPRRGGKGARFDFHAGMSKARSLAKRRRLRAVLLGRNVARCFGLNWIPLAIARDEGREFLMLPSPFEVNRWWKDLANVREAKKHVRRFVYGCGHETW